MSRDTAFPTGLLVRPERTRISLHMHTFSAEPLSSVKTKLECLAIHRVQSNDSDQPAHLHRLIWVIAWRTCDLVGNAVARLKFNLYELRFWVLSKCELKLKHASAHNGNRFTFVKKKCVCVWGGGGEGGEGRGGGRCVPKDKTLLHVGANSLSC